MRIIFDRGHFHKYSIEEKYFTAVESRTKVLLENRVVSTNPKVFLSHKHDDLEELKDIIGFLENQYQVDTYIDSMDKKMPSYTCGKTATRIKQIIENCDKFILLATDKAVESKWCNWELGFGDAHKFRNNIAILPVKDSGVAEKDYKGHEYMSIYPLILYYNGTEKYVDGRNVPAGYYYGYLNNDGKRVISSLSDWLKK
jgi:hypothetical protein